RRTRRVGTGSGGRMGEGVSGRRTWRVRVGTVIGVHRCSLPEGDGGSAGSIGSPRARSASPIGWPLDRMIPEDQHAAYNARRVGSSEAPVVALLVERMPAFSEP